MLPIYSFRKLPFFLLLVLLAGVPAWGQTILLTKSSDAGSGINPPPNILLPNTGALSGVVRSCYTNAPLPGVTVTCGTQTGTTNASGQYNLINIPAGNYQVSFSLTGFVTASLPAVILDLQTTTLNTCLDPTPGVVTGIVTNAESGAPIVGAKVMISASPPTFTYSVSGGQYTLNVYPCGTFNLTASKAGFDNWISGSISLICGSTITINIAMIPTANPVGPGTAVLNAGGTAVDISWSPPSGNYEILYDDGIQDDFTVWANAGNQNAMKFTPAGYPATLKGGSIDIGDNTNYPGATLPLTPFQVKVMDDDGPGGMPGTVLGTYDIIPGNSFYQGFTGLSAMNIPIASGSFYLVMVQGGIPPNACGIAVDNTSPQFRSYSRDVNGSGPWVPVAGNFMMRAGMYGPGGPLPPADNFTGTDNIDAINGYRVYRLLQGQESNQASWTFLGITTQLNYTDNSWPTLPCNPYRWAIRAEYFNGSLSAPTFTNAIGKCWTASVTVHFSAPCDLCVDGSPVMAMNVVYPDTVYHGITDTTGTVVFPTVWKGQYMITMAKFSCPVMILNVSINNDTVINISTNQGPAAPPATGVTVNEETLRATWFPPHNNATIFTEIWASGSFATNQWIVTGGNNWQISTGIGNPAPSAMFSWTPQCTNCSQMLTSKPIAGVHSPHLKLEYDIYLDNFNTTNISTLAVEIWDGTTWSVLYTHTNAGGDIPWTSVTLDIASYTDKTFKIRFHVNSEDTYSINNWNIDNVKVIASDDTPMCLWGYYESLNNVLGQFVSDTTWLIPPEQVVYGQTYQFCVTALYGGSWSVPACYTFVNHFVYAPGALTVQPLECSAFLSWSKPATAGGATPPGLMGYNIYRDQLFLHYNPHPDSLLFYDNGLNPGFYGYDVTAMYDLTPYGFPGQFDESMSSGHVGVNIVCGGPLPFEEGFEQGTFSFNGWTFDPSQGNWNISQVLKSSDPAADFSWQPILNSYNYSLVSRAFDASPWSCANIWFDFDYKLADRNSTGSEKLFAEVWYSNSWHTLAELSNAGSVNWTTKHLSIDGVKQKGFKIRFRAAGQNSADILHWYIDNIHLYGICKPPRNLEFTVSQHNVTLTWEPPNCGGTQVMQFIFDDGSAEYGWAINPGFTAWLGNEFPISPGTNGVLQSFDLWFGNNPGHGNEQLTIDVFDMAHNLVGSSPPFTPPDDNWINVAGGDIPFNGPFLAMVSWNSLASFTNFLGSDEDGPYSADNLAWCYDGVTWFKLTELAAWGPSVFLLRATALVNIDSGPDEADSSVLIGYNVYRDDGTGGPFTLRTPVPVTGNYYSEYAGWGNLYKYYVTSVFNDSESGALVCEAESDTVVVLWEGVDDVASGGLKVYPNPASQTVTVTGNSPIRTIEVVNYLGETVFSRTGINDPSCMIDVSSWVPGVWFVKVTDDRHTVTLKLVVRR